jgi:hypothetical protein
MSAFNRPTAQAVAAVRAAKNEKLWGPFAAMRYAQRHGVPVRMYIRALVTEQKLRERRDRAFDYVCPF